MLMYGRNQHDIVIILQLKINKEKNAHKFGPGIPFLKINRKDISGQVDKDTCQMIFIAVLFLTVKIESL